MAQSINYWKLAVWKACIGSVLCLAGVIPSLVLNWDTMTGAGRMVAVMGVIVALGKFLDGFFDQTFARLAQGKTLVQLPGMNGNSEAHQETRQETTVVTDIKPVT